MADVLFDIVWIRASLARVHLRRFYRRAVRILASEWMSVGAVTSPAGIHSISCARVAPMRGRRRVRFAAHSGFVTTINCFDAGYLVPVGGDTIFWWIVPLVEFRFQGLGSRTLGGTVRFTG